MKKIKKISLLFASVALLGVTLFSGNNEAKVNAAGEIPYKELTFPDENKESNKVNSYFKTWNAKIGEDTYTITNANNNSWKNNWQYIKFGNTSGDSVGSIITPIFSESISSVALTIDAVTAKYISSINISTADSTSATKWQWSAPIEFTIQKGETTVNLPVPLKNKSYKVEFDCKASNDNGIIALSKVSFYKENDIDLTNYENITNLIKDIGTVEYSDLCKAKIEKARNAYNTATSDVQQQVKDATESNLTTLESAENEYNRLKDIAISKANSISSSIDSLPNDTNVETLENNYEAIIDIKNAFSKLTTEEKRLIANDKLTKIENTITVFDSYIATFDAVTNGEITSKATTKNSNIKTNKGYYGVFGGNQIITSKIYTNINKLEINYFFKIGTFGAFNKSAHSITIGAYNNDKLVSNESTLSFDSANPDGQTFTGTVQLNDSISLFDLRITSTESSTTRKCIRVMNATFSYYNFSASVNDFIGDWASLRSKGGNNGICHYLTNGTRSELDAMLERYSKFSGEDKNTIDNASDGGTTIGNTIAYVSSLLAKLDSEKASGAAGIVITSTNNYDKTSLIALFAILGIVTISGYYIIEKKKSAR